LHQVPLSPALFLAAPASFRFPAVPSFLLLCALLLGCAVPIALAWARAIPAEDSEEPRPARAAVVFLALVTLSFVAQVPGAPLVWLERSVLRSFSPEWQPWIVLCAQVILILLPGAAALYAVFRTRPVDQPLLWASLLVVLLWLVGPFLTRSWLGASLF